MGDCEYGDWFCSPCTEEIFPFSENKEISTPTNKNKDTTEFKTYTDCSSCSKQVKGESMSCSLCFHWVHKKCIGKFSNRRKLHSNKTNNMPETFENMNNFYKNKDWFCFQCSKSIFPFHSLSDEDFLISNNIDTNYQRKNFENLQNKLREINLLSEIDKTGDKEGDFDRFDPDKNLTYNDNCEYTSSMNFKHPENTEIALLNFNIRSIKKNFDKFTRLLTLSNISFDAITLTETWMDSDSCPADYNIEGYPPQLTTRSGLSAGGTYDRVAIEDNFELSTPQLSTPQLSKTGKIDLEGVY